MMRLFQNTGGIAATNCFMIVDEPSRKAVLFDAPNDTVAPLLDQAQKMGFDVIGLWLTHGHFDHTADHALVTARFPHAKLLMHRLDEPRLIEPTARMPFTLPFVIPPRRADEYVEDGQVLQIGGIKVRVMHTPGHSPGHVMYHLFEEKVLVGGDLIIGGSVGRTDLPDASAAVLAQSVRRVMELPGETKLLPGHGRRSTLADELRDNEYVGRIVRGSLEM